MIRVYLKNFKNDFNENAQLGVFNCMQIIDYARNGDMSNEDFSALDLRMFHFADKNNSGSNFDNSYVSKSLFLNQGHEGEVYCALYNPNGKYIASASSDGKIKFWDSVSWNCFQIIEVGSCIYNISFSRDGRMLAGALRDNSVKVWDNTTGTLLYTLTDAQCDNESSMYWPMSLDFSPDGKRLVVGSTDFTINVWDIVTKKKIISFDGHNRPVEGVLNSVAVRYSQKGDCIASISATQSEDNENDDPFAMQGKLEIWDSKTGVLIASYVSRQTFPLIGIPALSFSHANEYITVAIGDFIDIYTVKDGLINEQLFEAITHVEYSPDDKYVVAASLNHIAAVFETDSWSIVNVLEGHSDIVYTASFSSDGRYIVSSSGDCTLKIWESKTGTLVKSLGGVASC